MKEVGCADSGPGDGHARSGPAGVGSAPRLWSETLGAGPDVVLLHGWGLHSGVWEGVARQLARERRVTVIDLPGFGASEPPGSGSDAAALAEAVLGAAPPTAAWVGWSLGGMVALQAAAMAPERVERIAMVAASPRFVQGEGWPHGMDPTLLERFCAELEKDYRATLSRFLALQLRGGDHARDALRHLRGLVFSRAEPSAEGLREGLGILRGADLRPAFAAIPMPLRVVLGRRDTLVPARVVSELKALRPNLECTLVNGAAHAPFISHEQAFLQQLTEFLHE